MTTELIFQVAHLDFDDVDVQTAIDALPQYEWANLNGISMMTVLSDGDVVSDAVQALRCATSHGIKVLRVFDEHVNHGEIARRIGGVSREAVRKWSQDPTFPALVGSGGGERPSPQYRWAEVLRWLLEYKAIDMDEELPDEKTVAAVNAHIHGLMHEGQNVTVVPLHLRAEVMVATVVRGNSGSPAAWSVDLSDMDRIYADAL